MKDFKINIPDLLCILFYKLLLDIGYVYFIYPYYKSMSFQKEINMLKFLEALLFIVILFLVQGYQRKPSTYVLKLIYYFLVIPMLSIYAMQNESRIFMVMILVGYLVTIYVINYLPEIKIGGEMKFNKLPIITMIVLVLMTILTYGTLFSRYGMPTLIAFDLSKVYELRSSIQVERWLSYLTNWQAKTINTFFLIYFIHNKKYKLAIMVLFMQLLLYMFTGHKIYLLYPFFVIGIMLIIQCKLLMKRLSILMVLANVGTALLFFLFGFIEFYSLFYRRLLMLPAHISFIYYEYFSKEGLVYLSQSVFKRIFEEPIYIEKIQLIIGGIYFEEGTYANTNYLTDAYVNFGFLGIICFSIILAVLLKIVDALYREAKTIAYLVFLVVPFILITTSALLTSLLTHGILLAILIAYLTLPMFCRKGEVVI